MSLAGKGAVAIWHDIAPEARDEFHAWHGRQHMPERVDIPGFLRGRRYVALKGAPEYFNLYEVDSPQTLMGREYLARLNAPTPWTVATVKHFRNVARSLCEVAATFGEGQGGLIATFRYDVDDARAEAHYARMVRHALPALAGQPGVAGCHLLVADEAASAVETAEKKVRAEKNVVPRWIVLVESWGDVEPFDTLCRGLLDNDVFEDVASAPILGMYRLQNSRSKRSWTAG
jgi:hypothetical protein